jgi:HD-GYP domain-containing protein (c-di-GMP phosphodiesterase class II)
MDCKRVAPRGPREDPRLPATTRARPIIMSTTDSAQTAEPAPPPEGGTVPLPDDLRPVRVKDLIIGRSLRRPIYDNAGMLLLAQGQVISSKFKELLRSRKIEEIQAGADEVANIAFVSAAPHASSGVSFDGDVAKKLDAMIESGGLFVNKSGPAVRDSLPRTGCKAYDPQHRQQTLERHKQVCEELDTQMQDALRGAPPDGARLLNTTALYLSALTSDVESVLTTAQEVSKDPGLAQHCVQMSLLAMAIGIELRMDAENVRHLGLAGLVHDWGMVKVPLAIRQAPRRLTEAEYMEVKKHPAYVLDFLERANDLPAVVALACYQVHERPNGTGYPRARQRNSIHPFSRILHVADQYVALTSPRPFRQPLMPYAAMECLLLQAKQNAVDVSVVRALLQVNSLFPIGSFVTLSDGSVARVLRRNGSSYSKPIVQLIQTPDGKSIENDQPIIDLATESLHVVQALPSPGSSQVSLTEDVLNLTL